MSTGDILDRTVRLYRRHFLHTVAIVGVPYLLIVPFSALTGGLAWGAGPGSPGLSATVVAAGVLFVLAYFWLSCVSMGALARSVSERFLGGTPGIWTAYAPVLRRGLSLIWAYLLISLAASVPLGAGAAAFFAALFVAQRFPAALGYAAAVAVGLVAVVLLALGVRIVFSTFLVTQVIVIEGVRGLAAVKRSWALMPRAGIVKAGIILVFGIVVAIIISFVFNIPGALVMALDLGWWTTILGMLLDGLGQVLAAPIMMIALTLLYYDRRIRQEAFDLEMMAANLGGSPGRAAPAAIRTTPVPPLPAPPRAAAPAATPPAAPRAAAAPPPQAASAVAPEPAAARPAAPSRPTGSSRVCPQCGARVPNILSTCGTCRTPVPFTPPNR